MKTQNRLLLLLLAFFLWGTICGLIGYSWGDYGNYTLKEEVSTLEKQLADCEEGYIQRYDENEKALIELAKEFAKLQSANITIETPDTKLHIEWER